MNFMAKIVIEEEVQLPEKTPPDIASILKKYKNIKIPTTFKNTKFDKVVLETLTLLNKVMRRQKILKAR